MVPPQPSSRALPQAPLKFDAHVFGAQHWPPTHLLVPLHAHMTSPQAFDMVVSQAVPHVGSAQHALLMQVEPAAQLNVCEPQALLTVPQ